MTKRAIIGLTGRAGAGKSTAAEYLANSYGFTRTRFAAGMKGMLYALGFSVRDIEGDKKEEPHALLNGKSPRFAMQTLGTEWGRNIIGENFWVDHWRYSVEGLDHVVVEDCRFPNEADAIRALGGVIIEVNNLWAEQRAGGHASEGQVIEPDYRAFNATEGDMGPFYESLTTCMELIGYGKPRRKKVYLAGPMTGYEHYNYPAFHRATAKLRTEGFYVFNPAEIAEDYGGTEAFDARQAFAEYTRIICEEADGIVMLPGWEESKGANIEHGLAKMLGLEITYLEKA
jgi:hypothetical protein